jgi:hypothetical protein
MKAPVQRDTEAAWYEHNVSIIANGQGISRKLNLWFNFINQVPEPYTDLNTAGVSTGSENVLAVLYELYGDSGSERVFPVSGVYRYGRFPANEPGQHDNGGTQLWWQMQVIVTGMMMLQNYGNWDGRISLTGPKLTPCGPGLQFYYDDVWDIGDALENNNLCAEVYSDFVRQVAGIA